MENLIQKHLFLIIVLSLFTGCVSLRNDIYNNSLEYVNDIGITVSFPESDITLEEKTFKDLIANIDTGTILYEYMLKPVPKELSDALFLGWYKDVWERNIEPNINDEFPYDSTSRVFEYYLNDCKKQEIFYYIGKVFLSEKFDSYLVATTESDEKQKEKEVLIKENQELALWPKSIYNRIYIVNVKESIVISMTMLWWAWDYDFEPRFTYTTISKHGVFRQRECNIFNENYDGFKIFNPETWFLRDPTKGIRFVFDENGKVVPRP